MEHVQVNEYSKTFTFLIKCAHTLVTVASAMHVYTQITGIINLIETMRGMRLSLTTQEDFQPMICYRSPSHAKPLGPIIREI